MGVVETPTQTLHRLTSSTWGWYEPSREDDDLVWSVPVDDPRVLRDLVPNDLDRLPWFFKRYAESLPRVALPRELPATTPPAVAALAGTAEVAPIELDLPHLSRLLHLCAGVVRTSERPFTTWPFRAAGSACARFPLEMYVVVPHGSTLPAGVHWYDPPDHALVRVGPPPRGDASALVVTGIPWRTGWRYRERGYRHVYWDAGTMLSQLLAAADSAGIDARLHTRFPDAVVGALVGADRMHEWPVAVVALRRRAGARGEQSGGHGGGRRGAARVPARHGGTARGRARHARHALGPRRAGRGSRRGRRAGRDRGPRARVAEAHGSHAA